MRFKWLGILSLVSLLCLPVFGLANSLPSSRLPVKVKVGFYLNAITAINEKAETLQFQGTLTTQWRDNRIHVKTKKVYADQAAQAELSQIWQPQVVLTDLRGRMEVESSVLMLEPGGVVTYVRHVHAGVASPLNLRQFPFDRQVARFYFAPFVYNDTQVELVKLPSQHHGMAKHFQFKSWQVSEQHSGILSVKVRNLAQRHSSLVFVFHYSRRPGYYILQMMLPLLFIVLFSFATFFMFHNPVVNRIAISLTAVLTIVVFHWRIFTELPEVSYHTFIDMLILLSLIMVVLTIIPSLLNEFVPERYKKPLVLGSRILFPLVYGVGILWLIAWYF